LPAHTSNTYGHVRFGAIVVVLALGAALCAGAAAAVRGDDGRVPGAVLPRHGPAAADVHPGVPAKRAVAGERMLAAPSDELAWPLSGSVTGRFGEARGGHMHAGLDVPVAAGTPIAAAASGKVVMREMQDGYGKYTCIAHRRISTCYAHQSRFRVALGDKVRRGQVIGYAGNTGNSPATHLHFEVRRGKRPWGKPVDPALYLPRP